ncbi:MAG TPA: hypothetical protein VHU40_15915, partial [Polyangia bacterium]|nr:hypothetical protein [Polyangia bacterium]
MESIARPLRRLQEELAWFARAAEVKLLHVRTDATLRGAVLDLVMAHESHADNRALFFRFADAAMKPGGGWDERARRLRAMWQEKTESLAPAGIALRPLDDHAGMGTDFGAVLYRAESCLAPPLTQIVAVIAPAQVEDGLAFREEMKRLVGARELGHVRWVVVEVDGPSLMPLVERLGDAALSCVCLVDEREQQDDLAALGAARPHEEVAVVVPPSTWRAPGAMPDVVPPPRADLPRRATDDELRAVGLSPTFVNGGGVALKQLISGAALALRQGQHADAVTMQARAASLCNEMEMPREQVLNLHVLGGYLLAGQARARAREVYTRAAELSRTGGFADLEAQSQLALGMLDAMEHRSAEAASHYAAAGRLAEDAQVPALAIECWRMAGQLAVEAHLESSAVDCWKRALSLAEPLDPKVAQVTSAAEIARALAVLCRK